MILGGWCFSMFFHVFPGYHIISGNQKIWNIQKIPEATTCAHLQARKSCCKAIFLALTRRWCLPRSVNHGPNAGSEVQRQLHLFCVLMTRVCLSQGPTKWIQMFLATCLGFARREKQAIHPRDILQYLAISCNTCRMAPSQPSLKRKQESGAVLDYVSLPLSLSLSLSIIIILKILIVIRFKSTKSRKTAVLDQRPLMVSQTVSASTQVALAEIGVSNVLALPWVGRQRQTKLQYGTCSSHLIVKLSMPYAFACWSSYPMSK